MLQAYKENPCKTLSIPYWKHKHISVPSHMRIVHHGDFDADQYAEYTDIPYFRLYHSLEMVEDMGVEEIRIVTADPKDIPAFVDVINASYGDLSVTQAQLMGYTQTEVYHPQLWIMAVDRNTSAVVGCAIADFDRELGEGVLEWVQVLPAYRRRGIGRMLVDELLKRMGEFADFATVSGKVDAVAPEGLYRKCGFTGRDVWHILTRK